MIVTVAEMKEQLRIDTSAEDNLLERMINQTEFILLDYMGYYSFDEFLYDREAADEDELYYEYGEDWADLVVTPAVFRAAMFTALAESYDNRSHAPLTPGVKAILRRFRNPVISVPENG